MSNFPPLRKAPPSGLGRLLIGAEERALVNQVLDSQLLNRFYIPSADKAPPMAKQLESELRQFTGAKHALAVTSGTAALECALGALGIGPGDEVILPAWSWIACFTAVVRLGGKPVLAEIDDTLCIDPDEIPRLVTMRTKAVMVIHFQGTPARMDRILEEARQAGIAVLEDCAQSPGATYKGQRLGSLGTVGTYSFQNQKTITSGEGGAVLTNDSQLFERAVRMHDLGLYRPVFEEQFAPKGAHFSGGQSRMSELTAAVALAQLRKLDAIRQHCQKLYTVFKNELGTLPGLEERASGDPDGDSRIEAYFFCDRSINAAELKKTLEARNVVCAPMTGTYCHYNRAYCSEGLAHHPAMAPFPSGSPTPDNYSIANFPKTEALVGNLLTLPFGTAYTEDDVTYMARCLKAAMGA